MSCIFHISGESLDIDALLSEVALVPYRKWKKGEARILKGKVHADSGANFVVSEAEMDEFPRQAIDATDFLELHAALIARMAAFPGVQESVFDFGVSLREGNVAQYCSLSPRLIQLAASACIGLEISHYAFSEADEG